tara:strand:- start:15 stop:215 length:201 start_codon:yes stop_codon:yes gene_type:complete
MRELELENEKLDINEGAIALDSPLRCSKERIFIILLHEMKRKDVRYGPAILCVGVGQGVSTVGELM